VLSDEARELVVQLLDLRLELRAELRDLLLEQLSDRGDIVAQFADHRVLGEFAVGAAPKGGDELRRSLRVFGDALVGPALAIEPLVDVEVIVEFSISICLAALLHSTEQ
jgi:hypothetical protein